MKKATLKINEKLIECMRFATRKSAQNYMDKKPGRALVFFKAHEYYVNK